MRRAWRWLLIAAWLAGNVWLGALLPPRPRLTLPGRATAGLTFTADGRQVLTTDNAVLQVWDAFDGRPLRSCPRPDGRLRPEIVLSPDGRWLMGYDEYHDRALLLDLTDGRIVRRDLLVGPHDAVPECYAFAPDGRTAAWPVRDSGGEPNRVVLWDVTAEVERASLPKAQGPLAFAPDGRTLAARDAGSIRFWDAVTGQPGEALSPDEWHVARMAFAPDGRLLILKHKAEGLTAEVWDVAARRLLYEVKVNGLLEAAWSPEGDLVTAAESQPGQPTAAVWDGATGATRSKRAIRLTDEHMLQFARTSRLLSPDGRVVVMSYWQRAAWKRWLLPRVPPSWQFRLRLDVLNTTSTRLWDSRTGRSIATVSVESSTARYGPVVAPDSRTLATVADDGAVTLWDVPPGKPWGLFLLLLGGQAMLAWTVVLWRRRRRARAAGAGR
jgi:WD40 repeat protein